MGNIFRVYRDTEHLGLSLAHELANLIRVIVLKRKICHMVFPGSRFLATLLKYLRSQNIPWVALHLYPSDERCVQPGHIERNDHFVEEWLFGYVPFPNENLHSIPAELGPEEAAKQYCQLLDQTPSFDIVLLGMGLDGHTASLFPGHKALTDPCSSVPIYDAPKPPLERVSIGLFRLKAAHKRWIVATGTEKCHVLARVQQGESLPVTLVRPTGFFVDATAATLLQHES